MINLSFGASPVYGSSPTKTYNNAGTIYNTNGDDRSSRTDPRGYRWELAMQTGRGGLGTLAFASSGNSRGNFDRADSARMQNSRHVMSIGAHTVYNRLSYFSSIGASVMMTYGTVDIILDHL